MRRTNAMVALALAASMPISGCATTSLEGEYRPKTESAITHKTDRKVLAKGSEWLFLWGLLDSGKFELDSEIRRDLRPGELITDLEVKNRLSVGGFFLWLFTGGIVSHHSVVAKGSRAELAKTPPPPEKTMERRETIIIPSGADRDREVRETPAGMQRRDVERERPVDKTSPEYREGYREGVKDNP